MAYFFVIFGVGLIALYRTRNIINIVNNDTYQSVKETPAFGSMIFAAIKLLDQAVIGLNRRTQTHRKKTHRIQLTPKS